jgi:hypothetical protein
MVIEFETKMLTIFGYNIEEVRKRWEELQLIMQFVHFKWPCRSTSG